MFESLRYLIPGQARRDFRDGEAMFRDGIDPLTLRISQYPYWKYRGYVNAAQRDEIRRLRNHTEALQAKITMMDAAWSQGWHCGLMDAPDGLTTEPPDFFHHDERLERQWGRGYGAAQGHYRLRRYESPERQGAVPCHHGVIH